MANTVSRYQPQRSGVTRLPDLVNQLFNESFVMPSVFDRGVNGLPRPTLPVNLLETGEGYLMQCALPGMNAENLDIQVSGREISIRGKFEVSTPENATWIWQGIPAGEFFETYTLPAEIDGNQVEASYEYGVLSITLPKAEHLRPKNIKVNVTK